jgi:hypothetical protein
MAGRRIDPAGTSPAARYTNLESALGFPARSKLPKNLPGQGQVWVEDNGRLRLVTLRPGVSDGTVTEVQKVLGGDLEEGMKVVVGEGGDRSPPDKE